MESIKNQLETYCELHWWNMNKKTLSFKGKLKDLLKEQNITFIKRHNITYNKGKVENEGIYTFYFKSIHGISWKIKSTISDFRHIAKQFIQMELVRMGDKSKLYVSGSWRPTVTVNF